MFFRSIIAVTLSAVALVYAADVTREVKVRALLHRLLGTYPRSIVNFSYPLYLLNVLFILFIDAQRRDNRCVLP